MFKSKDKDLVLVDNILKYLRDNINTEKTFKNIVDDLNVNQTSIKFDKNNTVTFKYITEDSWGTNYYLASCLTYLIDEGYVIINGLDKFKITYKGIIKYKINSFTEEGFRTNWGKPREFYLFILAFLSFLFAIFKTIIDSIGC